MFSAAFTTFFPGFIAFAVAATLTSGIATFSPGDVLTYRDAVSISAVSVSGVARAADDYHPGEYGPQDRSEQEHLRHQLLAIILSIPFVKYLWCYSR